MALLRAVQAAVLVMVGLALPGGCELLLGQGGVRFGCLFDLQVGDQHQGVGRCPPLQFGVPRLVDHFLQLSCHAGLQARRGALVCDRSGREFADLVLEPAQVVDELVTGQPLRGVAVPALLADQRVVILQAAPLRALSLPAVVQRERGQADYSGD